jgi:hypothetical protein
MRGGVSLVIDLFDPKLSKNDWRRIVESCVQTLLFENKEFGLRHIFIEEAAEFVPQIIPRDGVTASVYSIIERLARMGGNRRLGYTLINQRAEQVNKAVLELCDNLLLHRQKGKNSIGSLHKWLDAAGMEDAKKISESLPLLPQGECYAWLAGSENAHRVKVPVKNSYHPDRRAMEGDFLEVPARVPVSHFIDVLREDIKEIEADAIANDPKTLKAEIFRLTAMLKAPGAVSLDDANKLSDKSFEAGREQGYRDATVSVTNQWRTAFGPTGDAAMAAFQKFADDYVAMITEIELQLNKSPAMKQLRDAIEAFSSVSITIPQEFKGAPIAPLLKPRPGGEHEFGTIGGDKGRPFMASSGNGKGPAMIGAKGNLTGPEMRILASLRKWQQMGHDEPSNAQVAFVAGYSTPTSASYRNPRGALKVAGLIHYPMDGHVALTMKGAAAAPNVDVPKDLVGYIAGLLTGPEAKILQAVANSHPGTLSNELAAHRAGYSTPTSASYRNPRGALRTKGLIEYPETGHIRAVDWLFSNGAGR